MAFKGLEDRFKARADEMYSKYSAKQDGNIHPLLEFKPNDKNARETANDSRMLPTGSVKRDLQRVGKWSVTGPGILFLAKERLQQSANTFAETRTINRRFFAGNFVPYTHLKRPNVVASQIAVQGDVSQRSPGSDIRMGAAGRLQRETKNKSIELLMGKHGRNNIFSYLPTPKVVQSIAKIFSMINRGPLPINDRPELDFNDTYYSIALWSGFRKQYGFRDNLDAAAANLRVGNIKGALNAVRQSVNDVKNQILVSKPGQIAGFRAKLDGRGSASHKIDGSRYFLTSPTSVDSYLRFATDVGGNGGVSTRLSYMNRQPYVIGAAATVSNSFNVPIVNSPRLSGVARLRTSSLANFNAATSFNSNAVLNRAISTLDASKALDLTGASNPAEQAMLFDSLSLRNRYETDERLDFIKTQLQSQKTEQKNWWASHRPDLAFGYNGGYQPGSDIDINPKIRANSNRGGYIIDKINMEAPISVPATGPTADNISAMQTRVGKDMINVWFNDVAKSEMIPFRAYLSGLSESVTPEVQDTKYVGRIERNIIYMGVTRDVSFSLNIHALSRSELTQVWAKLERLVGLCYPGGYSRGFMVPPFVKLTLGDVYHNQPCYIKSLTHNFDDNTPWELEEGSQVPHGIKINLSISLIEKSQKRSGDHFYNITERN